MDPYFFNLEVAPAKENSQAQDIAGAEAEVWVFASSPEEAENKMLHYLTEYGWQLKEVKSFLRQPHELIAHLDKSAAADYQKAARLGISASFHGWPKNDRPGVFEVRPLQRTTPTKKNIS